ncbi:hypothetical protein CHS0354_034114 [Potamilus streckersoni]|uniref:FK506-binding protein n=1 Tax=Potamilus streckersoni TaxID=2493646 RepID=A0AAE0TDZ4_9BIVA|nr:hypothetical protein CHS0354_034114 [Potamilus streckersoni]
MVVLRELRSMFWGVTIDGGKRYTQTVERSFHISMAALEAVPEGNSSGKHLSQVSVMINHDKAEFLLCTLNHKHLLQQPLNLSFTEGEEVTFFLNGQGVVHLTGYLLEDHIDDGLEDFTLGTDEEKELEEEEMSDDYYEDSDEAPELVNLKKKKSLKKLELTPGSKRKATDKGIPNKKLKMEEMYEDESDEDDSDEDDDLDPDEFADFFDDEAEEAESDEEEDEEDIAESKTSLGKNQKQSKENRATLDAVTVQTPQNSLVAGGDANSSSKKKKKKKKKKNKDQEAGSNQQTAAGQQQTPKPQQQTPKSQQQTPKPQQQTPKPQQQTPKSQQQQQTPKKQVLAGGILMEELKVGNGPDAKKGKMVHVYYVGRLNNGKQFDSCQSGKPFRFRLGKNEVIKGWEIGLEGMKVGGKRRLTVPPQQGYGSQKQGEIPPNSTLIFEVELKAVS